MNVSVVDYSDKAIAIFGAENEVENRMKAAGGMFCPVLKGAKPGWVFSGKHKEKVEEFAKELNTTAEVYNPEKGSLVLWYASEHATRIIAEKGAYNPRLHTAEGTTAPGWIFSKTKQDKAVELAKALAA